MKRMNDEPVIWETYEHEYKKNSSDWYWIVGIITVALIVICILLGDTLFGIVIGLSVLTLGYYSYKEPNIIEVEIGEKGIRVDKKVYLFDSVHSFYIDEIDRNPKLILKSKKIFMPLIIVRMDGADPYVVHEEMQKYLPHDIHPEPIFHKILDRIGF